MKLLKFMVALFIVCFAFIARGTNEPPGQDNGMETIIHQNSNSNILSADFFATMELDRFGANKIMVQFSKLNNETICEENNLMTFKDYCYISRHRRTPSHISYNSNKLNSQIVMRKIGRPLIRGDD